MMTQTIFNNFSIDSQLLSYTDKECIFYQGATAKSIYLIEKGRVQLFRETINGNRIILHQAIKGQFFAEASINSNIYHCTAQCIGMTKVHVINSHYFNQLLSKNSQFSNVWIHHLSKELRRQRASVERLNLKTAQEKIIHYLSTEGNADGELELNHSISELAPIIGLSRESLYRTLSKMKKGHQIIQTKSTLKLLS